MSVPQGRGVPPSRPANRVASLVAAPQKASGTRTSMLNPQISASVDTQNRPVVDT